MRLNTFQTSRSGRRVILLDDSRTVLARLRNAFEGLGLEVITAEDPSELNPEAFHHASLIVVDVQMVHMFGDDIVLFLRESWQVKTPIYLYSSLPQDELDRRAAGAGANGAVCKAQGVDALIAHVKHLLVAV
jgi:DNA-binding response OmpR family regulator